MHINFLSFLFFISLLFFSLGLISCLSFLFSAFVCPLPVSRPACKANNQVSDAVEVRLLDAPELGFLTSDTPPRGEIIARTPRMTPGYFGADPSASFVTIGGRRFFRTGELAHF